MCGIAGALELKNQIPDRDRLRKMISVLSHRGPDGSGIAASGPMGLAHARLSIIDLEGRAAANVDREREVVDQL